MRRFLTTMTVAALAAAALFPAAARAADGRNEAERTALAVLRSDAPEADKAVACKTLAVHGTADCVPDLAKLLGNERLSSWARIPLEAIPDPACDAALKTACGSLTGRLLVGCVNTLGVRRDAGSVELLGKLLGDGDPAVVEAAAVGLGSIGDAAAAELLGKGLAAGEAGVRGAAAEGAVLCAERLAAAGQTAAATALYDAVRKADVPKTRVAEATRGAILVRGAAGIPLLVEQVRSPDRELSRIGLSTARELRAPGVDAALVAELPRMSPQRAALVIEALADRGGPAVLPALVEAAAAGPKEPRLAAVRSLGRIGDAGSVERLLAIAGEQDPDLAAAAVAALGGMSAEAAGAIDDKIRGRLAAARGPALGTLLDLVGRRRIAAVDEVVKALDDADPAVRGRAVACLGEVVDLERLPLLVKRATAAGAGPDAEAALKALRTACVRMPDRDACAEKLVAAMATAGTEQKVAVLDILGQVAGDKALAAIVAAARSDDAALQDASTRLLGGWMTADAGPPLLDLAKTMPAGKFQDRAFRGYLRILRQFTPGDGERATMGKAAYAAARDVDDRRAVLDAVKRTPTMDILRMTADAGEVPELRDEAREAAAMIVTKMANAPPEAWQMAAKLGLPKVQIEILRATYGAGNAQRDVTTPLKKLVGSVPLIPLQANGYNASFGGDPAPGQTKKLTVQYRLDGKQGEASFAEDAPILLPAP
jgi:HEAT repeat protein